MTGAKHSVFSKNFHQNKIKWKPDGELKRKRTPRVPRRQCMCPKFKSLQQRVCQPNGLIKRSHFTSTTPKNLPSIKDVIHSPPNRGQAKGLGAECCSWARICRKHQQRLQQRREKCVTSGRLRGEQAALFALAGFLFCFFVWIFILFFLLWVFFGVCGAKPQDVTRSTWRRRVTPQNVTPSEWTVVRANFKKIK